MASIRIEITGNTGNSIQELNNVAQAVENVGEQEKKVAKTEEEKWAEARARSERKKKWLEEQKKLEAEADEANGKRASGLSKLWGSLDDMVKKTQGGWTNLKSKVDLVSGAIGTAFGFISGGLEKIRELSEEYEKLSNQMTILSSQKGSGEIILQLERLEEATNGVVGKFDLLESVNKATSFGIDLTRGNLEKLVGVASKAAATMGTSLKDAFDSLVVGTARESMMILDNLGVMVDVTKANEDYARSLGKSKDELTDVESKTALLSQVLERLSRTQGNIVDEELLSSASGTFNRISRAWQGVKLTVGEYASEFLQWVDDWGRSEEQIENQKYKNMLGDVRDYYERKEALAKKDLDDETKAYLKSHQYFTAEQKSDYIREQEKKRIIINEEIQEGRLTDVKASNLNKRITDELIAKGQVIELWVEQEKQRQMILESGAENNLYTENYRMLANKGIHKMYLTDLRNSLNESQQAFLDKYLESGELLDGSFLLFKNRILDSVEFAIKALKGFEGEVKKRGEWFKGAVTTMFGLDKNYFDPTTKQIWDSIIKNAKSASKDKSEIIKDEMDEWRENQKIKLDSELALAEQQIKLAEKVKKARLEAIKAEVKVESEKSKYNLMASDRERQEKHDELLWENEQFHEKKKILDDFNNEKLIQMSMSVDEIKNISKEEIEQRIRDEKEYYDAANRVAEMGLQQAANFSSMLINDVLLGEKEFRKEMIGDFVKGIGTQMISDGTMHMLSGAAKGWAGMPTGWMEAKAGAIEVAAGIGMGGIGKAIGTTGGDKDKAKDEASKDKNETMKNNKQEYKVNSYLFPNERQWLQQLQTSQTRLNG